MEADGSQWNNRGVTESFRSIWTLMNVMRKFVEGMGVGGFVRKLLEFHDTRASRWRHTEVHRNSWKHPPNMVLEASVDGSNASSSTNSGTCVLLLSASIKAGSFQKLPCCQTPPRKLQASTYFRLYWHTTSMEPSIYTACSMRS